MLAFRCLLLLAMYFRVVRAAISIALNWWGSFLIALLVCRVQEVPLGVPCVVALRFCVMRYYVAMRIVSRHVGMCCFGAFIVGFGC